MKTEASVSLAELNDPPGVKFETSSELLPLAWVAMSDPSQARKVIGSVRPAPAVGAWKRMRGTPSASRTSALVDETAGNAVQPAMVPVVSYCHWPTTLTKPLTAE